MTEICLLGTTHASYGHTTITDFGGVKPRQIIEILALAHTETVSKQRLAELLWEGKPPVTYAATLESHVSVLRRHLARAGLGRDVVLTAHNGYRLGDDVVVDVGRVTTILGGIEALPVERAVGTVEALLPDLAAQLLASSPYAGWATAAAEELARQVARACRMGAIWAMQAGQFDRAVVLARRAERAAPLSESVQQVLLTALAGSGARADALLAFADYRERLHDELGVEPCERTLTVYLGILAGGGALEEELREEERRTLHRLLAQVSPVRVPVVHDVPVREPVVAA